MATTDGSEKGWGRPPRTPQNDKPPGTVLVGLWQLKPEQKLQPLLDRWVAVRTSEWTSRGWDLRPSAPCLDDFLWDQDTSEIFTQIAKINSSLPGKDNSGPSLSYRGGISVAPVSAKVSWLRM